MEYSLTEATKLKYYYYDLVIGQLIEKSFKKKVTEIKLLPIKGSELFRVVAGFYIDNCDFIYLDISKVALELNLEKPENIISK